MKMFKYVGSWRVESIMREGLIPTTSVASWWNEATISDSLAFQPAVFGFFEPVPQGWVHHPTEGNVFSHLIHALKQGSTLTLLEVGLTAIDDAWVYDWFPSQRDKRLFWVYDQREKSNGGLEKRVRSRISLAEYQDGQHQLPEIAVYNRIPRNRITVLYTRGLQEIAPRDGSTLCQQMGCKEIGEPLKVF
jgi:hypothetical protein